MHPGRRAVACRPEAVAGHPRRVVWRGSYRIHDAADPCMQCLKDAASICRTESYSNQPCRLPQCECADVLLHVKYFSLVFISMR